MNAELIAVVARHAERLGIVCAGALSLYLGYRMFLAVPESHLGKGGEAKVDLPGGIALYVTRLGPGIFFGLFGAVILVVSLVRGLEIRSDFSPAVGDGSPEPLPDSPKRWTYSSATSSDGRRDVLDAERSVVLDEVTSLSDLASRVERGSCDLEPKLKAEFTATLEDTRRRLLGAVWDDAAWGPYASFQAWFNKGMPPVETSTPPLRAFRGRR